MTSEIEKLAALFKTMISNRNSFGESWKNIELGKEAFALMKSLPETVPDEFDTPQEKASLLSNMLDQMDETVTPRFCIEVRDYIRELDPSDDDNLADLAMLRDFIDPSISMEEYCDKYQKLLHFDPVERSKEWEDVIYSIEKKCDAALKDEPRGMGFCFMYWPVKRNFLAEHGIEWKSPAEMNPRVIFD